MFAKALALISMVTAPSAMAEQLVWVSHCVQDAEQWRKIFDGAYEIRTKAGETSYSVIEDGRINQRVTVEFTWINQQSADQWLSSPTLRQGMADAGVAGEVTINYGPVPTTLLLETCPQ